MKFGITAANRVLVVSLLIMLSQLSPGQASSAGELVVAGNDAVTIDGDWVQVDSILIKDQGKLTVRDAQLKMDSTDDWDINITV